MEIQEATRNAMNEFEQSERSDGSTFYKLKRDDEGDTDEALHEAVREAHGDKLPNDWVYDTFHSVLCSIADYNIQSIRGLEEERVEICDGLVDVYTNELNHWAGDFDFNNSYIDEALKTVRADDHNKLLKQAQYQAIIDIYDFVSRYITDTIGATY